MGKRKRVLFGVLGVIGAIVTTFVAFLLFLGGISGAGNEDLFTLALIVLALPVILPTVFGLLYLVARAKKAADRSKDAAPWQRTPRKPFNPRLIARRAGSGVLVIAVGAVLFLAYDYISTREPALIRAIMAGDVPKVSALLQGGEDPNQLSRLGATPLMMALYQDSRAGNELAILLLQHGADPNRQSHSGHRRETLFNMTPIVWVVAHFDQALSSDVLALMLEKGVDLSPGQAHQHEMSPLMEALRSSYRIETPIAILLEAGARPNAGYDDIQLLLQFSVDHRDDRLVRMLIEEDTDGSKLERAMGFVDYFWRRKECDSYYSNLARLLKEEVNRRTGEVVYPESSMACVNR